MKVKYLCLWSRRVNIQFLYHRKKKAMSSLMRALMGYLISVGSAQKSWGRGNGSREGSGKSWWPKPAWWTPPVHKDAKSCLFIETAQLTDGLWKLAQKHIQENLLRFLRAVLWLLFLLLSFRKMVEEPLHYNWNKKKCVSPVFGDALQVLKAFFVITLLYTSLKNIS